MARARTSRPARGAGPVVLPLASRRVFAVQAVDWGRVGVGVLVCGLLLACLAFPLVALAQAACSGTYTRADGAYTFSWGTSVAAREAGLDTWCPPPCNIEGYGHTASGFDYRYDLSGGTSFVVPGSRFVDDTGAACLNPDFGDPQPTPTPTPAPTRVAFDGGSQSHWVQAIAIGFGLGLFVVGASLGRRW